MPDHAQSPPARSRFNRATHGTPGFPLALGRGSPGADSLRLMLPGRPTENGSPWAPMTARVMACSKSPLGERSGSLWSGVAHNPVWSPDGAYLVYLGPNMNGAATASGGATRWWRFRFSPDRDRGRGRARAILTRRKRADLHSEVRDRARFLAVGLSRQQKQAAHAS